MNPDIPIRTVPTFFKRGGYEFHQVWRKGKIAIYAQHRLEAEQPVAWEVVKLRVGKPHPLDEDQSWKEHYPSSEAWGVTGWTYLTWESAKAKAYSLLD